MEEFAQAERRREQREEEAERRWMRRLDSLEAMLRYV